MKDYREQRIEELASQLTRQHSRIKELTDLVSAYKTLSDTTTKALMCREEQFLNLQTEYEQLRIDYRQLERKMEQMKEELD